MYHNAALQLQKQEKECFHENAVVCLLWALFVCLFMLCAGVRPLPLFWAGASFITVYLFILLVAGVSIWLFVFC